MNRSKEKEEKPRKKSMKENFVMTKETFDLLEKVKDEDILVKNTFINRCIEEYGPALYSALTDNNDIVGTVPQRLEFLENVCLDKAYKDLVARLKKKKALAAHQKILKAVKPKDWLTVKRKLQNEAKKSEEASATNRLEWQLLARFKNDFLKQSAE